MQTTLTESDQVFQKTAREFLKNNLDPPVSDSAIQHPPPFDCTSLDFVAGEALIRSSEQV
jgi:hypothetical protein